MEDSKIVKLYLERNEDAIAQSSASYGPFLRSLAYAILEDREESEECENDSYLRAWNSIPPAVPQYLRAFLGRICRNLALDRMRLRTAAKRGGGAYGEALDELGEVVSGGDSPAEILEAKELAGAVDRFLSGLEPSQRMIFMRRYWYLDSIRSIADMCGKSEGSVKVALHRLRTQLKKVLSEEGIEI